MNELALFAGAGGGLLGSHLLGWRTRCAVEIEEYPRSILLRRQADGMLPRFPIWDDVRSFDGHPWRGHIDVVSGGFPCQDISAAGKGEGLAGARSGLWSEYRRIIGEVRPRFVFAENSPQLRTRGLGTVLQDLDELGYDARWGVLGAWAVGAPHRRDRMWVLGHARDNVPDADPERRYGGPSQRAAEGENQADRPQELCSNVPDANDPQPRGTPEWWETEPGLGRVAYGVADRMDRIKAIGNGQVPRVAQAAWELLSEGLVFHNPNQSN